MTLITEQAQLRLSLEGQQAINELRVLETETKGLVKEQADLEKQMKAAMKPITSNNSEYKNLSKTLRETKKAFGENSYEYTQAKLKLDAHTKSILSSNLGYQNYDKELQRINKSISENGTRMDEIRKKEGDATRSTTSLLYEQKQLQKTLRDNTFGTDEYAQSLERLTKLEEELGKREEISGRKNGFGAKINTPKIELPSTANPISEFLGGIGGKIATLAVLEKGLEAIWAGITRAYASARELSKAEGATAARLGLELGSKELAELSSQARQMGDAFNKTTPEVLSAYQEIGSLRPELMKDGKALAALAEDALILSGADGMLSVKESSEALAGSLSQFNEGTDQSRRFINALSQSSKDGSAEISDLAGTFKVAGTTLANNNISFEQSNALAQTLAQKMILGEQAGTNLRNIFSKLSISADSNLNPAIVGLNKSLENLSKLSPQQIVKLFGEENQVAANIIINERNQVDALTKSITGTNYAMEQFHAQTSNLDTDANAFGHAWDGIFEDFGKKYEGLFRKITQLGTETMNYLRFFQFGISIGEKDRTDGFFLQSYSDVKAQIAVQNEYKKQQQTAISDAKKVINEYANTGSTNEKVLTKQLNGIKSVISQSQAGISYIMDQYHTARKKNASKEEIQEILNQKKYFEAKYTFARSEEKRLLENEKRRIERKDDILAGQTPPKVDKKKQNEAAKILEERLKAEAKNIQDIAKLDIEAMDDEDAKKEAQLRFQLSLESAAKQQEVKDKKLTEQGFQDWYKASLVTLNYQIEKNLEESEKKKVKKAEETQKKLLDLVERTYSLQLQSQLAKAETKGDDFGAFNIKVRQLDAEREKELRDKELTEKQKFEIEKFYLVKHGQLFDELAEKEKIKTKKNHVESLQISLDTERNIFKKHDLQIKMLNAQEMAEIMSAEKTGASIADIHKKYAGKRKDIDQNLWTQIAQIAMQTYSTISEGIAQSRNLDAQAEQINLDNEQGRKMQALDAQLKNGSITQKKYDEEKLKNEEIFNEKQKKIKRKQAEADHDAAVIKATTNAIQSIIQTMTSVPFPFNIPLAAAQGVFAFDQVSKLAAMPIPEFFDGTTDTGSGKQYPQANDGKGGFYAILHPNEAVTSKQERIDYAKTVERYKNAQIINNTATYNQPGTNLQNPASGFGQAAPTDNLTIQAYDKLTASTDKLAKVLENPIKANVHFTSQVVNKISEKQVENEKLKNNI